MSLSGKKYGNALVFTLDLQGGGTPTDISAWVKSVDGLPAEHDMGDVTTGGSLGYKWLRGLPKATITLECVFDDAANSAWSIVSNFKTDTTTRSFVYGPAGSTSGYVKVTGELDIVDVKLNAKTTDPLMFTIKANLSGADTVGVYT